MTHGRMSILSGPNQIFTGMIRRRLTFANVLSVVALFVALGGASYAATQLPKNSVGTKQIKSGAVTGAKIKDGSVTGSKIKLSSLGTVPSAANATHAVTTDRASDSDRLGGSAASSFERTCPSGEFVTSVGVQAEPACEAVGGISASGGAIPPTLGEGTPNSRLQN